MRLPPPRVRFAVLLGLTVAGLPFAAGDRAAPAPPSTQPAGRSREDGLRRENQELRAAIEHLTAALAKKQPSRRPPAAAPSGPRTS